MLSKRGFAAILGSLLLAFGSFFFSATILTEDLIVLIESKAVLVYKGSLSEDRKVTIRGTYGDVRIQIRGRAVAIVSADCADKACVRAGWRSRSGQSITCIPNEIVIRITNRQ